MFKRCMFLLCALMCVMALSAARATMPLFTAYIDVTEPGAGQSFDVEAARGGFYTISLLGEENGDVYVIAKHYHLYPQWNTFVWDGLTLEGDIVPPGEYSVNAYMDEPGKEAEQPTAAPETPVDIGGALIHGLRQSTEVVTGAGLWCQFMASKPGTLIMRIVDHQKNGQEHDLITMAMEAGPMKVNWDATIDGERVDEGQYSIVLTYTAEDGETFGPKTLDFSVVPVSPAYSKVKDHTFWSMAPGETSDEAIWEILTQPITVFDNGHIGFSGHVYLMENPDGSGKRVAQVHGQSQGLHVLGDTNEYGYVLVETFSNYDPVFQPKKADELESAFELKQGYIQASGLTRVPVSQHIGLVVDKLSQRMYLFIDGRRVTEFIISTGFPGADNGRMYRETIAGEFITVDYVGGFFSNEIFSDLAIRFNGGTLIHEVPCYFNQAGKRVYSPFEKLLGTKASAGCVRVQKVLNPDGYNHRVLHALLQTRTLDQPNYKVLVWSDLGRIDTPDTWYESPYEQLNKQDVEVPELPV